MRPVSGVGDHRIAERKIRAGKQRVGMLIGGAAGLREAEIGEGPLAAREVRHQAFEHHAPGFVRVEAVIEEVVQVAAGLRHAEADRTVDPAGEHIRRTRGIRALVAQERHDIARRRQSEADHLRVLGLIDELVDRAGVEAVRPRDRDLARSVEPERKPGRRRGGSASRWRTVSFALRRIEVGGRIAQRRTDRVLHMVEDVFLAREPGDLRHDRDGQDRSPAAGLQVALPAAPHDGVAAVIRKPLPASAGLDEVVAARRIVQQASASLRPRFTAS